ncbi:chemotaxis protein CheA [Lentibacillus sp. Marseille-P4043]|uniref:chemotaxis protein CheA n=1 Tax=Lentibacillus sp. Marseille-P4043 TaxID=2040293 RepID=UPI000D0B73D7|nr:chemotaxis protein CheA [Lentibacillus sp. Marseille-P4043]
MDTNQYITMFLDESREHLQAVNDNLLELEKQPHDLSIVNEIFRSAHTLKGMAATMGFDDIASLTHQTENVLDQIRNSQLEVTSELIDILFEATEDLEEMVDAISEGEDGKKDVSTLISQLEQFEKGQTVVAPSTHVATEQVSFDLDEYQMTVVDQAKEQGFNVFQVTISLTEDCMLKAARMYMVFDVLENSGEVIKSIPPVEDIEEEKFEQDVSVILLSTMAKEEIQAMIYKVSEVQRVEISILPTESKETPNNPKENKQEEEEKTTKSAKSHNKPGQKTIRVNIDRIDDLMNLFEEVVIDRGRLEDISTKIDHNDLQDTVEHMSRVSEDMQNLILTMRMVPVEQVFNRFPRMVRGLAKDLDKKVNLEIIGAETELDRTVIDEIGDPLVHLIRNSIDHGVETPEDRQKLGKTDEGKLILRAFQSGNHVFIEIEDDGAGINREKVLAKAIDNGLVTAEQAKSLADEEAYQFIMSSGFSTADEISDISGRGVGLDVVKNKIESLGGTISIQSEKDKGSKFSIQLPLTLSILSTLLVNVQSETYAVPLSSIIETVILQDEQVMYAHGQQVMDFRGEVIPIVSLKKVFQVPADQERMDEQHHAVVVVKKGDKLTGLLVDSMIGQKEIVLKSLGNYLQDVYAISGATILGDGRVSLIIDPNALIK